ncbi:MAG: type III pantothenate kinase [Verrucomicrobia bacterium]|nr:type III pantothenate kinase [Verrucomicrobiota bacterium]
MILLVDIGNTNVHLGLANDRRVLRCWEFPTRDATRHPRFVRAKVTGAIIGSVVPAAVAPMRRAIRRVYGVEPLLVSRKLDLGIGIRFPRPEQIGADRLCNAVGVVHRYGAPAIVVAFGTALAFDVVNQRAEFIGGVIAPGLSAMTEYLYQKTALLPKIKLVEPRHAIGKSTVEAMETGAVIGYRGLVREILIAIWRELDGKRPIVVGTGAYAKLIAAKLSDIERVDPLLTMEGLRIIYQRNRKQVE